MVDIKRDLKSTVNDVNSVAEALKHLQGVATSLFGVLGNLTETFGNQVGRAATSAAAPGSGPVQFLTDTGASAREELIRHLADASEREFQSKPKLHGIGSNAVIRAGHGVEIGGASVRTFPDDPAARQLYLKDLHRAALAQTPDTEIAGGLRALGVNVTEKSVPLKASYLGNNSMAGIGYSVSDLARVSNDASAFKPGSKESNSITETIKRLSERSDDTSQTLALTLRQLQQAIAENNTHLAEATRNYRAVMSDANATNEQRTQAERALTNALGNLDQNMQQTRDIMRHGGGGGGGDDDGRGRMGRMQRWASGIGTALGLAGGATQMYMQAGLSMDKAVYGGELKYAQATGNIMQREFNTLMEAHDMTKAENLLRYKADVLMPGRKFDYIGVQGNANATAVARSMTSLQTEIDRQERNMALTEAGFGGAQGLLKIGAGGLLGLGLGWTGIGGIAAGGLIASGVGDLIGAGRSGINAYMSSPETALEGGLNQGLTGMFGRSRRGNDWERMADFAQKAAVAGRVDQMGALVRELQDAEMKKLGPQQVAINEVLDMVSARQQGAVLIGEYAGGNLTGRYEKYGRLSAEETAWRASVDTRTEMTASGKFDDMQAVRAGLDTKLHNARSAWIESVRLANEDPDNPDRIRVRDKLAAQAKEFGEASRMSDEQLQQWSSNRQNAVIERGKKNYNDFSSQAFIDAITRNESGGDYGVWNQSGSGAYGRYQMTGEIRRTMAARMGVSPDDFILNGKGFHDMKARTLQDEAMNRLAAEYRGNVRNMRADPSLVGTNMDRFTDFQLAMGIHHRGLGAFQNILKTGVDPNAIPGRDIHVFDYMGRALNQPQMGPPATAMMPTPQQVTQMTMLASLEMSGADFDRHSFQLSNALGAGTGRASDAATARMIRLGRSGLGSFEQQIGDLSALNRVSGGRDNTTNLEKILAEAVAQGFDKSRTAQAFVQSTMQVMTSLGLANTANTSTLLGNTAKMMGGGFADERTLAEAARGIEGLGKFTGQRSGIPGALKLIAASQSGMGLGGGAEFLVSSSLPEMSDMIEQIRTGNMTNKTRQFLASQGGDKSKAMSALRSNMTAQGGVLGVGMSMVGFDLDKNMAALSAAKKSGDKGAMAKLQSEGMSKAYSAGLVTDIGPEAAQAWYLQQQVGAGIITQADAAGLEKKINSGNAVFADPAKQKLRAYVDQMVADFAVNNRKVSSQQYMEYVNSGGAAYSITEEAAARAGAKGLAGKAITAEAYQSGSKEFKAAAEETFKGISKLDLARGAEQGLAALEGQVQSVRIVNFSEMVPALVMARLAEATDFKRDHNR